MLLCHLTITEGIYDISHFSILILLTIVTSMVLGSVTTHIYLLQENSKKISFFSNRTSVQTQNEKQNTYIYIYIDIYGHPKSSTLRLYTNSNEGGRGLVSIGATVQDETTNRNTSGRCPQISTAK